MSNPISPASPLLSNVTTTATNLGSLALVIPQQNIGYQPQNPPNPDGTPATSLQPPSFLFDYDGEQTAELSSDITDHYVENNTAIQDQIALRPVRVTTKGFVSELNDVVPTVLKFLKSTASGLSSIQSYTPGLSVTATLAYNQAFQAYQIAQNLANSAISAWSSLSNQTQKPLSGDEEFTPISPFGVGGRLFSLPGAQTKQQIAFQFFYGYWIHRFLFTVQTPWAIFKNMAIEQLRPIQAEDTRTFSTFECTFKQMRFANTSNSLPKSANSAPPLSYQSSLLNNQGTSTSPSSISLAEGISGPTGAPYQGLFGAV